MQKISGTRYGRSDRTRGKHWKYNWHLILVVSGSTSQNTRGVCASVPGACQGWGHKNFCQYLNLKIIGSLMYTTLNYINTEFYTTPNIMSAPCQGLPILYVHH